MQKKSETKILLRTSRVWFALSVWANFKNERLVRQSAAKHPYDVMKRFHNRGKHPNIPTISGCQNYAPINVKPAGGGEFCVFVADWLKTKGLHKVFKGV